MCVVVRTYRNRRRWHSMWLSAESCRLCVSGVSISPRISLFCILFEVFFLLLSLSLGGLNSTWCGSKKASFVCRLALNSLYSDGIWWIFFVHTLSQFKCVSFVHARTLLRVINVGRAPAANRLIHSKARCFDFSPAFVVNVLWVCVCDDVWFMVLWLINFTTFELG